jgi:hypothetical protein
MLAAASKLRAQLAVMSYYDLSLGAVAGANGPPRERRAAGCQISIGTHELLPTLPF